MSDEPAIEWRPDATGRMAAHYGDVPVAWCPLPGSQTEFLHCDVTEALIQGNRGGGKTDVLLMGFGQHVGKFGLDWSGIIFRQTFAELEDLEGKALRWFPVIFPDAKYNQSTHTWRWPGGEQLKFSYMERAKDYYKHHGHAYQFIGWEELTNWYTDECYRKMFSCLRSARPGVPLLVRSSCNPSGVGHYWVKERFRLPMKTGAIVGPVIKTPGEPDRVAIASSLRENAVMLHAVPNYADTLRASADSDAQRSAWINGSWDVVEGTWLADLWTPAVHVVPPIPIDKVPREWKLDRSYDDGMSKPFCVPWFAESNGEPVTWEGREIGPVKGDIVAVAEWYGWTGKPNKGLGLGSGEIADGIVEKEELWGVKGRVRPGPADTAIWNPSPTDPRLSVASAMAKRGVSWLKADKGKGSRVQGWKAIRDLLKAAIPDKEGRREHPGLFISSVCEQFLRTVPFLPKDKGNPDDIDTESEDHWGDALRYRVRPLPPQTSGAGGGLIRVIGGGG